MLATLKHYWRLHLAVLGAAAILTAVLTGALLVGDSMRGSLRSLVLDRLGAIDHALLSEGFFREQLAGEMAADPAWGSAGRAAAPAIVLRGAAEAAEGGARASEVSILGVDERFAALFGLAPDPLPLERAEGQPFPSVVLNAALARELRVAAGDAVLLRLARPSDVPRESLMGSTDPADLIRTLRVTVRAVVPDRGIGRFGLAPHQSLPNNAFVRLEDLQRATDQRGLVNALFLAQGGSGTEVDPASAEAERERMVAALRGHLTLEDLGLRLREHEGEHQGVVVVESRELLIRPGLERALLAAATGAAAPGAGPAEGSPLRVSTYLINRAQPLGAAEDRLLPYSTIAALDLPAAPGLGELRASDGTLIEAIGADQVVVNEWAAQDLGVAAGDALRLTYFEVGEREALVERDVELRVAAIAGMSGLGADPSLTPEYPGVSDADDMSAWDPTFPVDLGSIRERDEEYWDRYRGAPKLFVAEALGRRLWGTRFGDLTSIRLQGPDDDEAPLFSERLRAELVADLELRAAGLEVLALRAGGLRAARGATDFGGLFFGFSLFLIVAAALLVGMFFRLGVELRVREVGLRLAVGERVASVRRRFLAEGLVLAALGGLLGLVLAIGYAALMVYGLTTWWRGAVGVGLLEVHVGSMSLLAGVVVALLVVLLAVWHAVRKLARRPVPALLRGALVGVDPHRAARRPRLVMIGALLLGVALLGASAATPVSAAAPLFFGVGAAALVAGIAGFALWLRSDSVQTIRHSGWRGLVDIAAANASRYPGRSLLGVSLVAAATFVIVAVGAYGHRFDASERDPRGGGGGFQLVAEADVPVFATLDDAEERADLGFSEEASAALDGSRVFPFRLVPGDDVSCLNLYQPERPRLLGVPHALVERGGFSFQQLAAERENPWTLLEEPLEPGVLPAFGDYNSVLWILKSGLGKEVELIDESGVAIRLRLVGLLRRSLFQSELLISEANLRQHFPSRAGAELFLVETPPDRDPEQVAAALEGALSSFGFDAIAVAQRLASYQAVENTYLATFQILGGLGLLLGTVGLAVILLRNVLERLAELATLRAIGFRRTTLAGTVMLENLVVLVAGMLVGTIAALVAIAPHLRGGQALVPWTSLAITLLAVLVVGILACLAAVRQALAVPLLGALRSE